LEKVPTLEPTPFGAGDPRSRFRVSPPKGEKMNKRKPSEKEIPWYILSKNFPQKREKDPEMLYKTNSLLTDFGRRESLWGLKNKETK